MSVIERVAPAAAPPSPVAAGATPIHATKASVLTMGDRFILFETATGYRHLVVAEPGGARKQKGLGVFDPGRFVGQHYGTVHKVTDKEVVLLRPTLADLTATIARKAQIITPKDAARIVFELGIGAGNRVLESGIGSAGLTIPLAWAVGATGKIVVQELREEFATWAMDNLRRAGLAAQVEIHIGDLTQGLAPAARGPFEAVVLDQPEPWLAIAHIVAHLAPGATLAAYTPQVSQLEQTHRALSLAGFADVRALELIERGWEVKERGSRPSFDGLGHTGFLVFGRWLGPAAAALPKPPAP